ncbi:hypothetical protein [Syntrophomonas erecta]
MILSLAINTLLFFIVLNLSYIKKKMADPEYPDKPFTQLVLFPLSLGIVFTLIVDVFKGIMFYQLIIFILVAIFLYWIFFVFQKK